MEKMLARVMELKNNEKMDSGGFLTLLSLVNLMGLVELIGQSSSPAKTRKNEILFPLKK